MKAIVLLTILLVSTVPVFASDTLGNCATSDGLALDRDCDGIADAVDNCLWIANPSQQNQDGDAYGDACDLTASITSISPGSTIPQGGAARFSVTVRNRGGDVVDAELELESSELGIGSTRTVELNPGDHQTIAFVTALPCVEPGLYDVALHLHDGAVESSSYTQIRVVEDDVCAVRGMADTLFETLHRQDTFAGETARYPFAITNLADSVRTYRITVDDGAVIGSYRIEPSPEFTLGGRETAYGTIVIETSTDAQLGRNVLPVQITDDQGVEETSITLRVMREQPGRNPTQILMSVLRISLIVIVIALIIAALILTYRKFEPPREESKDFGEYY